MSVSVTMLQTRRGEDGNLWLKDQTYTATDAFARLLVSSNLATATFADLPQSGLSDAQVQAIAVPLVALETAETAAANRAAIQAALNRRGFVRLAGIGTCWIDDSLIIDDGTHLVVDRSLRLKQTANGGKNLLATRAFVERANTTTVTISWAAELMAVVTWPAHGLTVADYVWVQGATEGVYNQVFPVHRVLDADSFEIVLPRKPNATAAGTIVAKRCTRDWSVTGGVWDYNNTENTATSGTLDKMCIVAAVSARFKLSRMRLVDLAQRGVQLGAVMNYELDDVTSEGTKGDGFKVYGPARKGKISFFSSLSEGDDGCSIQPKEADAFSQYRFTFGDVIGLEIDHARPVGRNDAGSGAGALVVYASDDEVIDGIEIRNFDGYHEQAPQISIKNGDGFSAGRVERVTISGLRAHANSGSRAITTSCDIGVLKILDVEYHPGNTSQSLFRQGGGSIDHLIFDGAQAQSTFWPSVAGNSVIDISSAAVACKNIQLKNVTFRGASASFGRLLYVNGAPQVRSVILDQCDVETLNTAVQFDQGAATLRRLTIRGGHYKTLPQVVDCRSAATVNLQGADFDSISNGVVRAQTGTIVVEVTGGDSCTFNSAAAISCVAPATANPKGWNLPVDIGATNIAKAAGNFCFNIGAARGTIPQNRPVVCDGTSWFCATNLSQTF